MTRRLPMVGLVAALALTAACNSNSNGSAPPSSPHTPHATKSAPAKPGPHIPVRGHRTLRINQVAQLGSAGQGAAMLIRVGKPRVSTTRLSPSYGDNPIHGYFVNFPIKILNIGTRPLILERLDFYVDTPGLGKVNTNEGAAPYSGAPRQLDTTELEKGQSISNFLAFDVSTPHGKFIYGPGGKTSVAWRF